MKIVLAYQHNFNVYVSAASWLPCPLATLHRSSSSSGVEIAGARSEFSEAWTATPLLPSGIIVGLLVLTVGCLGLKVSTCEGIPAQEADGRGTLSFASTGPR